MLQIIFISVLLPTAYVNSLNNGLALTPPMGWISWAIFEANTWCEKYPDSCLNEQNVKAMADRMAADGYKELGYQYVNIDDSWSEHQRDSSKRLVADKKRFPNGMKALADYVHSKGLKLGLYGAVGNETCAGYPAQNGPNKNGDYFEIDAQTFAEWGIDSFKFDQCKNAEPAKYHILFPQMERALNKTGRKILFSCEWFGGFKEYELITQTCNLNRVHTDVADSWQSITFIIDEHAKWQDDYAKYNGPGHWIDPDMLVIGNYGLTWDQSRVQMALWAIWSSPLYMSTDLRKIKPEFKEILQNKRVIAVNNDELGITGKRVHTEKLWIWDFEVWSKPMTPIVNGVHSYAVVYLDRKQSGSPQYFSIPLSKIAPNLNQNTTFTVHDLMDKKENNDVIGDIRYSDSLELLVNPCGVRMVKLVPNKHSNN